MKSVQRLIEVLNANPQGCNQYGCKKGAGQATSAKPSGVKVNWARSLGRHGFRQMESHGELVYQHNNPAMGRITTGVNAEGYKAGRNDNWTHTTRDGKQTHGRGRASLKTFLIDL